MQIFPSRNQFQNTPASAALLYSLLSHEQDLQLTNALLYHSFPLYRDDEGGVVVADCVLLSPIHGVITFALTVESRDLSADERQRCLEVSAQVPPYVHSRLIKNRQLRVGPTQLAFQITPVIFGPLLRDQSDLDGVRVISSDTDLIAFLEDQVNPMPGPMFEELVATIDGAKGLVRPKKRVIPTLDPSSKGRQADLIEAAITLFDQQQKHGIMSRVTGPQRIRGLAGSGKTIVLAMMAAQALLHSPNARIAFTFYTKSLYQHVKRLITRFYRQFDDRDPDWDRTMFILHGWGGTSNPGLYSQACDQHGVRPLSYQQAGIHTAGDRFDYACNALLASGPIAPMYDYIFVDEGQDFPASFVNLCHSLAIGGKFVLAYDDLQTIFQATTPTTAEIFGVDKDGRPRVDFQEDIVLHKCYRNPREVLVSAHALGFGLYGEKIVQMIESVDHWENIGYEVKEGTLTPGSRVRIERPSTNSLATISEHNNFDEIVSCVAAGSLEEELDAIANGIREDIKEGLRPDDILVVSVDDRNAKTYLSELETRLHKRHIQCNNLHTDSFGIRDFAKDGRVTLSTVHKAKGNEAFMVYVVGVDAVMRHPSVRRRNMLFTAMTRAKGWVRMSGLGEYANTCLGELLLAHEHYPALVFTYPGQEELKIMKSDLAEGADRKLKARRLIEQLKDEFTDEEIAEVMQEAGRDKRKTSKVPRSRGRRHDR